MCGPRSLIRINGIEEVTSNRNTFASSAGAGTLIRRCCVPVERPTIVVQFELSLIRIPQLKVVRAVRILTKLRGEVRPRYHRTAVGTPGTGPSEHFPYQASVVRGRESFIR
jgi:hypothetical protein